MNTVRVGLIGSGFVSALHHEAFRRIPGAEVVAVASPTPGHAERFAALADAIESGAGAQALTARLRAVDGPFGRLDARTC